MRFYVFCKSVKTEHKVILSFEMFRYPKFENIISFVVKHCLHYHLILF